MSGKNMKLGRKLGQVSLNFLKRLFELGEAAIDEWDTMAMADDFIFNRRRFYQRMYNLERQGYVKRPASKNRSFFHLTPKGRLAVLKYLHLEKIRRRRWDQRWRILIFDIPEARRKARERLRIRLKTMEFQPLQESVYISPFPVDTELENYLSDSGLRKYTRYLTVSEIDNDYDLKSQFNLS